MTYKGTCTGDKAQPHTKGSTTGGPVYYVQATNGTALYGSIAIIQDGQTWDDVASGAVVPNTTSGDAFSDTTTTICTNNVEAGGSVGMVNPDDVTDVWAVMDGAFDPDNSGCDFSTDNTCVPQVTLNTYTPGTSDTTLIYIAGGLALVALVAGVIIYLVKRK